MPANMGAFKIVPKGWLTQQQFSSNIPYTCDNFKCTHKHLEMKKNAVSFYLLKVKVYDTNQQKIPSTTFGCIYFF
jgi:hypothetical protein